MMPCAGDSATARPRTASAAAQRMPIMEAPSLSVCARREGSSPDYRRRRGRVQGGSWRKRCNEGRLPEGGKTREGGPVSGASRSKPLEECNVGTKYVLRALIKGDQNVAMRELLMKFPTPHSLQQPREPDNLFPRGF